MTISAASAHRVRIGAAFLAVAIIGAACSPAASEPEPTTTAPQEALTSSTSQVPPTTAATSAPPQAPTTATVAPTTTVPTTTEATVTTSTAPPPPTTIPAPTTTTLVAPPGNAPPEISITSPGNLSSHVAAFDRDVLAFRSVVSMSATASDPDGDPVTVDWFSSISGYLGTGEFITASLVTLYDSSQPFITARATDIYGAVSEDRIQIIVWVPSDT